MIVERVVHLVAERGLRPGAVLVVTFSRRARQELVERLAARLPDQGARVAVATLHALGRRIILRWPEAVGYRPGRLAVYGPRDRELVLDEALRDLGRPAADGDARPAGRGRRRRPARPAAPADADRPRRRSTCRRWPPRYEALLRRRNAIDFVLDGDAAAAPARRPARRPGPAPGGLRGRPVRRGPGPERRPDRPAAAAGGRPPQPDRRRRRGAGDLRLPRRRPAPADRVRRAFPDARAVVLDVNYRSTAPIVAAANALVAGLPHGHALASAAGDGPPVVVHRARDEADEAAWVAGEIAPPAPRRRARRLRRRGRPRTAPTPRPGRWLAALRAAGIPCRLGGPGRSWRPGARRPTRSPTCACCSTRTTSSPCAAS